jgi:hypothetical protein
MSEEWRIERLEQARDGVQNAINIMQVGNIFPGDCAERDDILHILRNAYNLIERGELLLHKRERDTG